LGNPGDRVARGITLVAAKVEAWGQLGGSGNRMVVAEFQCPEHGSGARLMESSGLSMSFDGHQACDWTDGQSSPQQRRGGFCCLVGCLAATNSAISSKGSSPDPTEWHVWQPKLLISEFFAVTANAP
jgi:hypothetical protein